MNEPLPYYARVVTRKLRIGWTARVECWTIVDGDTRFGFTERQARRRAIREWRRLLAWGLM